MTRPHEDDLAVDEFVAAMKAKLKVKRRRGKRGWREMSPHRLAIMLIEHCEKGDPVDIANFAMFLWHVDGKRGNGGPLRGALREVMSDIILTAGL